MHPNSLAYGLEVDKPNWTKGSYTEGTKCQSKTGLRKMFFCREQRAAWLRTVQNIPEGYLQLAIIDRRHFYGTITSKKPKRCVFTSLQECPTQAELLD